MRYETWCILGAGKLEDAGKCAAGAELALEEGSLVNEN